MWAGLSAVGAAASALAAVWSIRATRKTTQLDEQRRADEIEDRRRARSAELVWSAYYDKDDRRWWVRCFNLGPAHARQVGLNLHDGPEIVEIVEANGWIGFGADFDLGCEPQEWRCKYFWTDLNGDHVGEQLLKSVNPGLYHRSEIVPW
jgi:hypothetical protein